jgi:hypothetical protein
MRQYITRRVAILLATVALALSVPLAVFASHQFTDVPNSNLFHADIDALVDSGVTFGCAPNRYCPNAFVTRGQMAAFMNRLGALAPGKTPVVNASKVDGLDANQIVRAADDLQTVNTGTTPTTASLMSVTAPKAGGLLIDLDFTCASFSGTTNTRWDVNLTVDGAVTGGSLMALHFPHADLATATPGDSASNTVFHAASAGAHTIGYRATRLFGDGTLDCNIYTSSLFVPFGNAGGLPAFQPEAAEGSGVVAP